MTNFLRRRPIDRSSRSVLAGVLFCAAIGAGTISPARADDCDGLVWVPVWDPLDGTLNCSSGDCDGTVECATYYGPLPGDETVWRGFCDCVGADPQPAACCHIEVRLWEPDPQVPGDLGFDVVAVGLCRPVIEDCSAGICTRVSQLIGQIPGPILGTAFTAECIAEPDV